MSAVRDLLDRLAEIGATLEPTVLRAGATPVPAELVRRLRQSKRALLEELNPARCSANPANQDKTADAAWWRDRYAALVRWFQVDRRWVEAEAIAYGELLDEWHKSRGRRWPVWQCAGCDEPIGGLSALLLADENRVHFDEERECLIRFGRRWRGEAVAGLQALGFEPPPGSRCFERNTPHCKPPTEPDSGEGSIQGLPQREHPVRWPRSRSWMMRSSH